ncbi:MAG: hypothetical protein JWN32_697 [Solirubrobacterales bacterium]|nr:hypothetical protein [Solirubrobacterales bacterium]
MTRMKPIAVALVATVAALATGCGGASKGPNGAASSSADTEYQQAIKFSQCMRSHGLPNFPDPTQQQGGGIQLKIGPGNAGAGPGSAKFTAANQACRKYAPIGRPGKTLSAAQQQQFLRYSQCMRTHGVPNFPDPKFTGGGAQLQLKGTGPGSPGFDAAQKACQSVQPGGKGSSLSTNGPGGGSVGGN